MTNQAWWCYWSSARRGYLWSGGHQELEPDNGLLANSFSGVVQLVSPEVEIDIHHLSLGDISETLHLNV